MSKLDSLRPQVGRVLVVDDEPDIRDSVRQLLESKFPGVRVTVAADGREGLAALRKDPVDLVISDYKMPGMDGLEMLVKAKALKPNVPRILITAYPELDVAMRAINDAEITNFLTKPLTVGKFLDIVHAALVKSRSHPVAHAPLHPPAPAASGPL